MAGPTLQAVGLAKAFPGVQALSGVSLELYPGEIHGLLGENGAGKSTLIKCVAGIYQPDAGEIRLQGQPVQFATPRAATEAGIATIHQELNLARHLTVAANVALGREPVKGPMRLLDRKKINELAQQAFRRLNTEIDPEALVADLGVGTQQMVEIARALSLDSQVLILDEPTAALTEGEAENLFRVLEGLRQEGVAILYISHRLEELYRLCQKVTVLRDGHYVGTYPLPETPEAELVQAMVGRPLDERFPPRQAEVKEVVLEVGQLQVRRGEVVGIAGLVGSGRSELLRAIMGLAPCPEPVRVFGQPLAPGNPQAALQAGLCYVPEDRKIQGLFLNRSVKENLGFARLSRQFWVKAREEKQLAAQLIERLNIRTPDAEVAVETLSGGNQQKVVLGRWLAEEPQILLLDEPTRGVDVGAKAEIYRLINELAEAGKALLIVSSELPELMGICDRIYVMREGQLTAEFARPEFEQTAIMAPMVGADHTEKGAQPVT